jgi:hypothetical protein
MSTAVEDTGGCSPDTIGRKRRQLKPDFGGPTAGASRNYRLHRAD